MPRIKLNYEQLREFCELKFQREMIMKDIIKYFKEKYNISISKNSTRYFIKRAIGLKIITGEDYTEYKNETLRNLSRKGLEMLLKKAVKKYGSEKEFRRSLWERGIGSSQKKLREAGRKGGIATQRKHPHVLNNLVLVNEKGYRIARECYYEEIKFDSEHERFVSLLLLEYGLIKELIPGKNFQKKIGRIAVDFYIEERNFIIEYHPLRKNDPKWEEKRKKKLRDYLDAKLIVIKSPSDFYQKTKDMGIFKELTKETWKEHREKVCSVVDKIKKYEERVIDETCPF